MKLTCFTVENVFPPSPSDVLLVFGGTLIGVGTIDFLPALLSSTLGSTLGFMTAYLAGRYFERRIIEGRPHRYMPVQAIRRVERWFQRFGYGVIVANRFLAGTRAVVSFFAGMSRMNPVTTTALCALSAAAWNALLLPPAAQLWHDAAGSLESAQQEPQGRAEQLTARTAEALRASGSLAEPVMRAGDPRAVIVDEAQDWGADLIVVGSHGYTGLKRWLIGSVALSVVNHAPCSVEVVRRRPVE